MNVRQSLKEMPLVSDTYFFIFRNDYWRKVRQLRKFYAQFVKPGDLVFDIGANVGMHTRVLLGLEAQVVAVDPVSANTRKLHQIKSDKLIVMRAAVSDTDGGTVTVHVASECTDFSTLSTEWMSRSGERFAGAWDSTEEANTVTLDGLIRTYGQPAFIKIDVEGHESEVLDGMSRLRCPISFEFNAEWIEAAMRCLDKPIFANAEFNIAVDHKIVMPLWDNTLWDNKRTLTRYLLSRSAVAGDILVRPR